MDEQRALLDSLMGRNRDGDRPEEDIADFRHPRVCKPFLCGLCPHELFQNTRMDLGACAQLHLPKLKAAYEAQQRARDCGYELELERVLTKYLAEVDRKIGRAQRRLEEQEAAAAAKPQLPLSETSKEVLELTAEIQDALQQAEEAGNEGEVDKSLELMKKVEELKLKKADVDAKAKAVKLETASTGGDGSDELDAESPPDGATGSSGGKTPHGSAAANQKLRVCDVCGAFLSIFDSDRRLADHFGGKLHLGYVQIRKKVKAIAELRRERRKQLGGGPADEARGRDRKPASNRVEREERRRQDRRSRSKSRSRSRPRRGGRSERTRDRSRSRDQQRSRGESRSRDRRDNGASRSGHRRRRRHRSRSRSSSRSSSRSKSQSRSRDRRHRR